MNNITFIPGNLGKLVTIAPPDPPTGSQFVFDVPVHTLILPISLNFTLTTSASAGVRTAMIEGFDGSDSFFISLSSFIHNPSVTRRYVCQVASTQRIISSGFPFQPIDLSQFNYLRFGDAHRTAIDNLLIGDQISDVVLRYMQWIQE